MMEHIGVIRDALPSDLERLRELVRRANDSPYDLAAVVEEKCFGRGYFGPARTRVFVQYEALRGVAVSCGQYLRLLAVDRSHRGRGIGSALMLDSRADTIGAEPGNYFLPGVLEPEFFLRRGYREVASTWNLSATTAPHPASGHLLLAVRGERTGRMLEFVEAHFGPVWRFEAERAEIAHFIDGVGFAVAEANNKGLGTFGPMGVAPEHRGKGHGRRLLLACLEDLHARGFAKVIIPWTEAIEFYRRACGAEPAHRFVTLKKSK